MKYKKIIIWLGVVAIIIFGGYWYFSVKTPSINYVTENVTKGDLTQTVSSTGELKSSENISLSFRASGKIEKMNVEVGDKVVNGQQLAVIEKGILSEQLQEAEADIIIQKETLKNMRNNKAYSKEQRNAQKAVVQKAEIARNAVLRQIQDAAMVSPMDGIVVEKKIDAGEMATANSTVITIAKPDNLVVEVNISEADIIKIALNQKATLTFDALDEKDIFTASVIEIDPAATVIQDVVYYRIKLKLDNTDNRLKIGMSCNIDVLTAKVNNVLMIPQRAIKNEDSRQFVEVLQADGVSIERVYIEVGLSGDNGMIEIKNNLKTSDKIVTFTKSI